MLLTQGDCQWRDPLHGGRRPQPPKCLLQPQPQPWPSACCPSACRGPSGLARECLQLALGQLQTRSSCKEERARRGRLSGAGGLSPDNSQRSRRGQLPPCARGATFQSSRSLVHSAQRVPAATSSPRLDQILQASWAGRALRTWTSPVQLLPVQGHQSQAQNPNCKPRTGCSSQAPGS